MKYNFMDFIRQMKVPEKGTPCVYTLLSGDDDLYVGQTTNLSLRLYQHLVDGKAFTSFEFEVCKKADLNNIEAKTIVAKNPTLNKTLPNNDYYVRPSTVKNIISGMVDAAISRMPLLFKSKSRGPGSSRYIDMKISDEIIYDISRVIEKHLGPIE